MQTVVVEDVGLGKGFDVLHTVELFVIRPVSFVKQRVDGCVANFGAANRNRVISLTAGDRIGGVVLIVSTIGTQGVDTRFTAFQILNGKEAGMLNHLTQLRVHLIAHTVQDEVRGFTLQTFHGIHQRDVLLILEFHGQAVRCQTSAASAEEVGGQILPSGREVFAASDGILVVSRASCRQPAAANRVDLVDSLAILHVVERVIVVIGAAHS